MKTTLEKNDTELKKDVLAELGYEPGVNIADIGVLVKDGAVTLNGFAINFNEKTLAVRATKRVAGVRAVADDIIVRLGHDLHRADGDIASAAASQLGWFTTIPPGKVSVTVRDGWVTLEGQVEWWYQKGNAQDAIQPLAGVKGVNNLITISPKVAADGVQTAIEDAFERSALLDAGKIKVETSANKVILTGTARNSAERDEAERVAWACPGVWAVDNQIHVEWSWGFAR